MIVPYYKEELWDSAILIANYATNCRNDHKQNSQIARNLLTDREFFEDMTINHNPYWSSGFVEKLVNARKTIGDYHEEISRKTKE